MSGFNWDKVRMENKMWSHGSVLVAAPKQKKKHPAKANPRKKKADAGFYCPKCDAPMVMKKSIYGFFLSCKRYPACDGKLKVR